MEPAGWVALWVWPPEATDKSCKSNFFRGGEAKGFPSMGLRVNTFRREWWLRQGTGGRKLF